MPDTHFIERFRRVWRVTVTPDGEGGHFFDVTMESGRDARQSVLRGMAIAIASELGEVEDEEIVKAEWKGDE